MAKCLKVKARHHKKLEESVFRKGDELKKRRVSFFLLKIEIRK